MLTCVCVRVRVRVRVSVLSCPVLLCVLDREVNMPRPFTDRLNVEFQKAGVRGLSLFFATGDDGASGITCRYGNCSIFNPTFPPSSPYVTSVGGTQIGRYKDTPTDQVEVVADSVTGSFITSGGGFSNRYAQPSYQSMAVQSYIKTAVMPPASMDYNTSNRAYVCSPSGFVCMGVCARVSHTT